MTATQELLDLSLAVPGNPERLNGLFARALSHMPTFPARSESPPAPEGGAEPTVPEGRMAPSAHDGTPLNPLTLAYIGGSITQGCHASRAETRWVSLVTAWFRRRFPRSSFVEINAGVGATTSLVGAHRLERDVLARRSDLVIVDFAVNDPDDPRFAESFESLIRDLVASGAAVLALFMAIEGGRNVQTAQSAVCARYGVPALSFRDAIMHLIASGAATWRDLEADEVHPNDCGHELAASLVTLYFERVLDRVESASVAGSASAAGSAAAALSASGAPSAPAAPFAPALLPSPVFGARYSRGRILSARSPALHDRFQVIASGFKIDSAGFQVFSDAWKLDEGHGTLEIEVMAATVNVLYLKSVSPDAGTFTVFAGGDTLSVTTAFPGGWGDYAETVEVLRAEAPEITPIRISAEGPVTILGILVAGLEEAQP